MLPSVLTALFPLLLGVQADPILPETQIREWVRTFAPIVIHDSRENAPLTSIEATLALRPELQGTCPDGIRRKLEVSAPDFMQEPQVQDLIGQCSQELAIHFQRKIPKPEAIAYYSVL
ncbi:MAG: hypothetical protein CVV27_04325, partial [Candidatus Melainabacteria bacterium HGW-Melainabacteria-1]